MCITDTNIIIWQTTKWKEYFNYSVEIGKLCYELSHYQLKQTVKYSNWISNNGHAVKRVSQCKVKLLAAIVDIVIFVVTLFRNLGK